MNIRNENVNETTTPKTDVNTMLAYVEITVLETIIIEIPKGFMNTRVSTCNHFIADTNNSANWDTIKFPLPKGKWSIRNIKGKMVTLGRTE